MVTLKEQKRVTDPVWLDFLRHLRFGRVREEHLRLLRSLVISNKGAEEVNFADNPWKSAALVTPRHAVRVQWNKAALYKQCHDEGKTIYVCNAEDTHKGRFLTIKEKCLLETHRGKRDRKGGRNRVMKDLPFQIEVAVGMKVMITDNVETDLDITNGARGEIVGVVLHEDEPDPQGETIVKLKYLPAYILVKLLRTRATKLQGLDECVVPVEPITTTYRMKIKTTEGKVIQCTIQRRQFPITGAYSFTDYHSQGQTIHYVLIDIGPPPHGTLSLFNLYVALSRSSGRETIRLLCDFDDKMFQATHDSELLKEDARLDDLDQKTLMWYEENVLDRNSQVLEGL